MYASELLAYVLFGWVPGVVFAGGVWLLVRGARRWLGLALTLVPVVFVGWSLALFSAPMPRWMFELGHRLIWEWYTLYHGFDLDLLVVIGAVFLPAVVVAAAAVAHLKGRRWALVLLPMAFAPQIAVTLAGASCNDPQNGCGFTVAFAGLGGLVVFVVGLVASPFISIPGERPPRPRREETTAARDPRGTIVGIAAGIVVLGAVMAGTTLWLTNAGASLPAGVASRSYHPYPGSNSWVTVLGVDADGHVWTAAAEIEGGPDFEHPEIGRFDGESWTIWSPADGLPSGWVRTAAFPSDGSAWFAQGPPSSSGAGGFGVLEYHDDHWTVHASDVGLPSDWIVAIEVAENALVKACSNLETARVFDGSVWRAPEPGPDARCSPDAMWVDGSVSRDGRIWESGRGGIYVLATEPGQAPETAAAPQDTAHAEAPSTSSGVSSVSESAATTAASTTTTTAPWATTTTLGVGDLETGLFCRDLVALGYGYADAVVYWVREGSPDRMDADGNGIPCETVYSADEVAGFWGDPLPTTTSATPGASYSIATHADPGLWPDALPGSGGWWGSGCSPGSGTLPDGIWWGYLTDITPTSLSFDLACIQFVSESDDDPATEDHAWLIENANERLRVVPVRPDALVACMWRNCPARPFPYREWIEDDSVPHGDGGREGGVWLYVNDGIVTEIADAVFAG